MRVYYWPSDHWIDDDAHAAIQAIATSAEADVRAQLPTLEKDLYLLVNQTDIVIAETGDGGYTIGPHCIRWDVDPVRGVESVARTSLRRTLFHECHHAVRLQRRPEDAEMTDWRSVAVFEGLATVFEDLAGGGRPSRPAWRRYDTNVIADWAAELLARPVGDDWMDWKFEHPDGRRYIAYQVGTWLVDRAADRSGRSAADLVWEPPDAIIELQ